MQKDASRLLDGAASEDGVQREGADPNLAFEARQAPHESLREQPGTDDHSPSEVPLR